MNGARRATWVLLVWATLGLIVTTPLTVLTGTDVLINSINLVLIIVWLVGTVVIGSYWILTSHRDGPRARR